MTDNYTYRKSDYDQTIDDGIIRPLFLEFIVECEERFHADHKPLFANYLFASPTTMMFLEFDFDKGNTRFGIDLIDNMIDLDTNLKMETYSQYQTVYALGSGVEQNKDEPVFLVVDDSVPDNMIVLKYISDDDNDEADNTVPIETLKDIHRF